MHGGSNREHQREGIEARGILIPNDGLTLQEPPEIKQIAILKAKSVTSMSDKPSGWITGHRYTAKGRVRTLRSSTAFAECRPGLPSNGRRKPLGLSPLSVADIRLAVTVRMILQLRSSALLSIGLTSSSKRSAGRPRGTVIGVP